jgi:hypothetical protein
MPRQTTRKTTPPVFSPLTDHEFENSHEMYDEDIRGLHRIIQPVEILEKKVRYIKPALPQVSFIISFIIDGFKDLLFSPEELATKNRNEVFTSVLEFVSSTTANLDTTNPESPELQKAQETLSAAFSSEAAIRYLLPVMKICFPDLKIAYLTNDAFVQCFNRLFEDTFGG